jgi:hypothetical protein
VNQTSGPQNTNQAEDQNGLFLNMYFFAAFTLHESCDVIRFWKQSGKVKLQPGGD